MTGSVIFSLSKPKDLLYKIKFERGEITTSEPNERNRYQVLNVILSLNHLFEWALGFDEYDTEKKQEIIKLFNPYDPDSRLPWYIKKHYQGLSPFPVKNHNQSLIKELSNNFKHFKLEKCLTSHDKKYLSVAGQMYSGGQNAYSGYFEEYGFFVEGFNGKRVDLLMLFDGLIISWENLIL